MGSKSHEMFTYYVNKTKERALFIKWWKDSCMAGFELLSSDKSECEIISEVKLLHFGTEKFILNHLYCN